MFSRGLTYGDVLIVPKYSDIDSRLDIAPASYYLGDWRLPIISAPMDTVSGPEMVAAMRKNNAYGILHRFGTGTQRRANVRKATYCGNGPIAISIGVKDFNKTALWLDSLDWEIHSVCIDVAHGDHKLVVDTIKNLIEYQQARGLDWYIIAGNVATEDGFYNLSTAGADAVRVGIGPGSACTTRETTGIGVPQLTAVLECANVKKGWGLNTDIIADGGIQNPGDIAKALAAGADAVMLGKMLAGADESASPVLQPSPISRAYKTYKGQSLNGSNGLRGAPEGIEGFVKVTGPVKDTLDQLMHYLRSSMSYVGARNLEEFREKAEFIEVSPATYAESATRLGVT